MRRVSVLVLLLVLAGTTIGASCGGGGGGGGGGGAVGAAEKAAKELEDWAASWRNEADNFSQPTTKLRVDEPPVVHLPTAAERVADDVGSSETTLSNDLDLDPAYVQEVFCTWFDFYLQTGQTVPSEPEFEQLLFQRAFGRIITSPTVQVQEAVQRFHDAIVTAQSDDEAAQNATAAAICAIPI